MSKLYVEITTASDGDEIIESMKFVLDKLSVKRLIQVNDALMSVMVTAGFEEVGKD